MVTKSTKIEAIRHSLAHLLAASVLKLWPGTKLGIGPVIENGFYYDILPPAGTTITQEDLQKIEKNMRALIAKRLPFTGKKVTAAAAKKLFKNQPFKLDLIKTFVKEKRPLTVYTTGDFIDLCRGGHVRATSEINPQAFKLTKIAGAYWRGDEKNPQLTRIYGTAFAATQELNDYLAMLAEAEKRDHRVLGERLGIFMFSEKTGQGFPLLLPNGETVKHELQEYMREKELAAGYRYVATGALASGELYEASGHKQYFSDDMYRLTDAEGKEIYVKPMNCPHHHVIYRRLVRSYRDLPLRLAEAGAIYRNERSGTLFGLIRVRGPITQNDAHIYVGRKDLEREFIGVITLLKEVYRKLGVKNYWFRLSLPDFKGTHKAKFGGDKKLWQWAARVIQDAAKKAEIAVMQAPGEAAFYGPKLDVQTKNVLGKEDTIATIQVDILVPKRMGLAYIDNEGKEQNPIVIHRAILGSYERFIAFLLEQTAGDLPFWLAPVQILIIPIGEQQLSYAKETIAKLRENDIRAELSEPTETLSKRIREGELQKIPYLGVVGDREAQAHTISVRERKKGDLGQIPMDKLIELFEKAQKGK